MIINSQSWHICTRKCRIEDIFYTFSAMCHLILCNVFVDNNIHRAFVIFVSASLQKMGSSTTIFSILRYVPVPSYTLRKSDVAIDILVNKLLHDTGLGQMNHDRLPEVDASCVIGDNILLDYNKRVHGWHHPNYFFCARGDRTKENNRGDYTTKAVGGDNHIC